MCACSSASVSIVDGLKEADRKAKCPLCRVVIYMSFIITSSPTTFLVAIGMYKSDHLRSHYFKKFLLVCVSST